MTDADKRAEADVVADPGVAHSREPGGNNVGRIGADDTGDERESGAERRAQAAASPESERP